MNSRGFNLCIISDMVYMYSRPSALTLGPYNWLGW